MKDRKMKCSVCKKEFITQEYIAKTGPLKGHRIIKSGFCSPECKKEFNRIIDEIKEVDDRI